jgi:hypothetical protein
MNTHHSRILDVINRIGGVTDRAGLWLALLDRTGLLRAARQRDPLDDFGDPVFLDGLEALLRSATTDAGLSFLGRLVLRDQIVSALVNRLRLVALRKERPQLDRSRLTVPPLIITGLPRSGTTFLHRLLAEAPGARALPTWQLWEPIPGPGPDRRLVQARRRVAMLRRLAPDLDAKHRVDAEAPEECVLLFSQSFFSVSYWMFAPVYSYLEWLIEQDSTEAYRDYRTYLLYFQAQSSGERLTLKSPSHMGALPALLDRIPEALVVQTHRDPVPICASTNSLFRTFHGLMTDHLDLHRMARTNVSLLAYAARESMKARQAAAASGRVYDIRYDDLVGDALGTVRDIYRHFDLAWGPAPETRLRQAIARNPQHKHGCHAYSAAEFGLDETELDTAFAAYREHFGV